MKRGIAIAAAVGALATAGVAVAHPGGGPLGIFGGGPDEARTELAQDLAGKLPGVTARQIEDALEQVQEDRQTERRAEMAKSIAGQLDGVTADQVAASIAKVDAAMEKAFESQQRPDRDLLVTTLAADLDKTEAQIRTALAAARKAEFTAKIDEALRAGEITKAQANQLKKRAAQAPAGGREFRRGGPGGPGGAFGGPPPGGAGFGIGGPLGMPGLPI
jgi:hypothetical protein